jgi:hypothetical protein
VKIGLNLLAGWKWMYGRMDGGKAEFKILITYQNLPDKN